jgi:hypothetical protein
MRIEVILDQSDGFYIRILLCKFFHEMGIVHPCSVLHDTNHSFPCMKVKSNKDATCPVADVFIVLFLRTARFHGYRHQDIANQLAWPLVETDNRMLRIIWLLVES